MTKRQISKILNRAMIVYKWPKPDIRTGETVWSYTLPGPNGTLLKRDRLKKNVLRHKRNTIKTLCELLADE